MANLNWKERLIMEIHYVNMASWLLIVLLTCMLYKCILHMYIIMYHDIITEEKEREHVYKTLTFSRSFPCTYTLFSKPTLTFHCYAKKNNYTLMLSLSPPECWCKWWGFENNDTRRVLIRKFFLTRWNIWCVKVIFLMHIPWFTHAFVAIYRFINIDRIVEIHLIS